MHDSTNLSFFRSFSLPQSGLWISIPLCYSPRLLTNEDPWNPKPKIIITFVNTIKICRIPSLEHTSSSNLNMQASHFTSSVASTLRANFPDLKELHQLSGHRMCPFQRAL